YAKLIAGIRHEEHEFFGRENLPSFGLVLNPLKNTVLKFNHGKHFKAPTPNDLFWPEDDYSRGNPDLKPQTGWHTNVTLEREFPGNRLGISLSWFNWNVEDKIVWAENPAFPGPFGDKWTPVNLNKSRGTGWEFGLKYDPFYALGLSFAYTYTDAGEETPALTRDAQYVPEHSMKSSLTLRSDLGITATATLRYTGDRKFYKSEADISPTQILDA
ncbi:MAG: TonB-dependent receptor, partial [bacterium]|nr:TonB-dependent receptor [bacterium]